MRHIQVLWHGSKTAPYHWCLFNLICRYFYLSLWIKVQTMSTMKLLCFFVTSQAYLDIVFVCFFWFLHIYHIGLMHIFMDLGFTFFALIFIRIYLSMPYNFTYIGVYLLIHFALQVDHVCIMCVEITTHSLHWKPVTRWHLWKTTGWQEQSLTPYNR